MDEIYFYISPITIKLNNMRYIFLAIICFLFSCQNTSKIEAGQIWTRIDSSDPFKPASFDTVIVLDVKKDYAKVKRNGDTVSYEKDLVPCCGFQKIK